MRSEGVYSKMENQFKVARIVNEKRKRKKLDETVYNRDMGK